ncbi:MAG: CAAX prenyl protease-related protein [bacterium]
MQVSLKTPLAAYVAPFLTFMGGLVLVSLVKQPKSDFVWLRSPEYWVYPLQTTLCAAVLVFYWRQYDFGKRAGNALAVAAGLLVLGLWVAPQAFLGAGARVEGFDPTVFAEGCTLYWMTVLARFARLVIVVPLVEEIFWRGFLMRYLIREDFTSLPIGAFQWKSFAIVAGCFMLVHSMPDWPAAFLCGAIYNFIAIRTGSLAACVLAHAVTNLGLGVYIMTTKQWGFW